MGGMKTRSFFMMGLKYAAEMRRIERADQARFLTFSCFRSLKLFRSDAIKDVFVDQLCIARQRHDFLLHAWVVMPEHVHMVVRCPGESDVPSVLRTVKTGVAKRVIARWRALDARVLTKICDPRGNARFWQRGGGYDRNLVAGSEVHEKIGYVHANPVRRSLVRRPTDWAWSSARWWSGERQGQLRCDPV